MNITVVGSGYVGLVTGACIAEMGNRVYCVDVDKSKIENLKQGILPIYEPGLEDIVRDNHASERLIFTTSLAEAVEQLSRLAHLLVRMVRRICATCWKWPGRLAIP